jgi:hypothetical protein
VGDANVEIGIAGLLLTEQNGEGTPPTIELRRPAALGIFACLRSSALSGLRFRVAEFARIRV